MKVLLAQKRHPGSFTLLPNVSPLLRSMIYRFDDLHCLVKCSHIHSRGGSQMENICSVRFGKRTHVGSFFYQVVKSRNCLLL